VYIGGKKVANIYESGTVIGEMALLLGEKRTATIKSLTDSNITIIKPENLKEIAQNNRDFFLNIAVNLSHRLEHNCSMIREIDELFVNAEDSEAIAPPEERVNYKELLVLLSELEKYESKYKFPWMKELLKSIREKLLKIRESFS